MLRCKKMQVTEPSIINADYQAEREESQQSQLPEDSISKRQTSRD